MHPRTPAALALTLTVLAMSSAQAAGVLRCTDARGQVVYTDGACPRGTVQTGAVPVVPSAAPGKAPAAGPVPAPRDGVQAPAAPADHPPSGQAPRTAPPAAAPTGSAPSPPAPEPGAGFGVIGGEPRPTPDDQRGITRQETRDWVDPWQGYPGGYYPGAYPRPPRPLPDQRPRMRHCDAGGCTDTEGSHYDRRGRLDRYQGPDGKTCRPVGTTTICR